MKRILNCCLIIVFFMFIFVLIDNSVNAATLETRMITCSPGEDASVEMNIGWHTDLQYTESCVIYTTKDDVNWTNQKKVKGTYVKEDCFNGLETKNSSNKFYTQNEIFLDYHATLTDLQPNTEYMYKVGQNVYSDVQYFKTAGSNSFSFAWISDFHAEAWLPNYMRNAMNMIKTLDEYNNGFDFIFSTGDEVNWGASYNYWNDLFNEPYHKNYMWANLMGNHDYMNYQSTNSKNDYFRSVHAYPENGYEGEEGVCYYFKYSNCLFITMNNETQTTDAEVKKAQDWFEEVVQSNPAQYIIVAQHYQWFNGVNGKTNSTKGYGRWKDLFDKYQVDLALAGNNHVYVRSHLLYQDKLSTDYHYGTTYIQAPSSDNDRGQAMEDLQYNQDWIAYRFSEGGKTIGGCVVNVTEEGIKVELLNRAGQVLDTANIKARRDVFPMGNFDKEVFENNISVINTTLENKNLIKVDNSGIGYVQEIEVLNNGISLTKTNLKKKMDTILTVSDLPLNTVSELDVKITYKDKTTSTIKVKVDNKKAEGKLTNFYVGIDASGYKVTFDNEYKDLDNIKVYLNDELVKTEAGTIREVIVPSETKTNFDIITIEAIRDNAVVSTKKVNYYSSVDLNCDGIEDKKDVLYLQEQICNNLSNEEPLYYYLDINNDGVIDITDATYLLMYIDKKIDKPVSKQFKVKFLDGNGKVIEEILVNALEDAIIETPTYEGYTFVGWDKDITNITSDLEVSALYSKN